MKNLDVKNIVKVVIPIYTTEINSFEMISLQRVCDVLCSYPLVVVKPASLDLSEILNKYPFIITEDFDDGYFRNIAGYNRLMLSEDFYSRFIDSEYILIYQLDAYVFRDELKEWCQKGYDYVGAPWLVRPMYSSFPMKQYRWLFRSSATRATDFKVGNGGFSLRKVSSHLRVVRELKDIIDGYLHHKNNHVFNEDVFFSVEVNKHGMDFCYPSYMEALKFSFDKYPALCYELNKGQLPFGCHSWFKKRMYGFWSKIIDIS
ncbi:MAG: DUF5672 family protein [Parabacteroides sp.]|nr:DUF5672 family protein [Parabacteroides sp.]